MNEIVKVRPGTSAFLSTGRQYTLLTIEPREIVVSLRDEEDAARSDTEVKITEKDKQIAVGKTNIDGEFRFMYDGDDVDSLQIEFPLLKFLPDFDALWRNYHGELMPDAIKEKIGNKANAEWIKNTCTLRMSRAFNYSGFEISRLKSVLPDGRTREETVSGSDGKWYAFRVDTFRKEILEKEFGKADIESESPHGRVGVSDWEFLNRRGVILFDVPEWSDATGHLDLWNGEKACGASYFERAKKVSLWQGRKVGRADLEIEGGRVNIAFRVQKV